jgi:hypothetical protein
LGDAVDVKGRVDIPLIRLNMVSVTIGKQKRAGDIAAYLSREIGSQGVPICVQQLDFVEAVTLFKIN